MREISRESVTIEWKPPLDDGGLELTKYAIERQEPGTGWVKVADVNRDVETYCIQRLNDNFEYMFRVMAQNPIGYSEALESDPIIIKTALGKYLHRVSTEYVNILWTSRDVSTMSALPLQMYHHPLWAHFAFTVSTRIHSQ